jgi:hypothetical protein
VIFPEGWEKLGWSERQWIFNQFAGACFTSQHQESSKIYKSLTEDQRVDLEEDLVEFRSRRSK